MKSIITTLSGSDIWHDVSQGVETVTFLGKMDIDDDGRGPSLGDPDYQNDTSLHGPDGKPLDATTQPYVVTPPQIIQATIGVVLGCLVLVIYNGVVARCVCADIGPSDKCGEASIATAQALGIPSSPINGGVSGGVVYVFYPGIAAPGFNLQPS